MRHSVLKTTALALLLVVFVAVVITARWADKPAHYPQVSQEIPAADARSAQDHSALPQTGLSHRADLSQPQVADAFAAAWSGRADSGLIGSKNQDRSIANRTDRLGEDADKGGEPPDNSNYVYGDDDVE